MIRVKKKDLLEVGIERVPRVTGALDGKPRLEDGRIMEATNVVWCTGFHPGFSWIDLPGIEEQEQPVHRRGVVEDLPGLYFVGLKFLHSVSSEQIHGVERDADYIANTIARRNRMKAPGHRETQLASA